MRGKWGFGIYPVLYPEGRDHGRAGKMGLPEDRGFDCLTGM